MATQNTVKAVIGATAIRHGDEGGCVACQHPIRAHFDNGAWIGCPDVDEDTTFILVPVKTLRTSAPVVERRQAERRANGHDGNGNGHPHPLRRLIGRPEDSTTPAAAPIRTLRAQVTRPRFVYHCADRRVRPALTPVRGKVYDALKASPKGLVYSDLRKKTKLVHGSVQQTLNWLRNHKYVVAEVPKS